MQCNTSGQLARVTMHMPVSSRPFRGLIELFAMTPFLSACMPLTHLIALHVQGWTEPLHGSEDYHASITSYSISQTIPWPIEALTEADVYGHTTVLSHHDSIHHIISISQRPWAVDVLEGSQAHSTEVESQKAGSDAGLSYSTE